MPMPHASLMPPQYIPTSWGNVFQETAELPLDVTAEEVVRQSVSNHGLSRTTSIWFTIQHPRILDQRPCPDGIGVAPLTDQCI